MFKVMLSNLIIPLFSIGLIVLENLSIKGERILSIKYRLWIFDYGFILVLSQIAILIITFFVCKKRKERLIALTIFFLWILIIFFQLKNVSMFD